MDVQEKTPYSATTAGAPSDARGALRGPVGALPWRIGGRAQGVRAQGGGNSSPCGPTVGAPRNDPNKSRGCGSAESRLSAPQVVKSALQVVYHTPSWLGVPPEWFQARAEWLTTRREWFGARAKWFTTRPEWLEVHSKWFTTRREWLEVHPEWFEARFEWLDARRVVYHAPRVVISAPRVV